MKDVMLKYILPYSLFLFIGVLLGRTYFIDCSTCIVATKIDTIYIKSDTVKIEVPVEQLVVKYKEVIKEIPTVYIDTVTAEVDSAAIVRDFLTANHYDQVLLDNSTGYIRLKQTIYANKIDHQQLTYLPPHQIVIKETNYVRDNKLKFTVGGEYHFKKDCGDFSVKAGAIFNSNYMVTVGYSMDNFKSIGFNYVF